MPPEEPEPSSRCGTGWSGWLILQPLRCRIGGTTTVGSAVGVDEFVDCQPVSAGLVPASLSPTMAGDEQARVEIITAPVSGMVARNPVASLRGWSLGPGVSGTDAALGRENYVEEPQTSSLIQDVREGLCREAVQDALKCSPAGVKPLPGPMTGLQVLAHQQ